MTINQSNLSDFDMTKKTEYISFIDYAKSMSKEWRDLAKKEKEEYAKRYSR